MKFENWGLTPYEEALKRQLETLERVSAHPEGNEDIVILCSHEPVVTCGRGTQPGDLKGWDGPVFEISRGGRATYHGPSQLIVYPIFNLAKERKGLPCKDLHAYLRALERAVQSAIETLGVSVDKAAEAEDKDLSFTGVWIGSRKVASIGIAVKKWIAYHGIAINVENDPRAFQGIRPCGFRVDQVTSLESELGFKPNRQELEFHVTESLKKYLS